MGGAVLPIDPHDVGRDYRALVRINSQSGRGGAAHLLRTRYGIELPRRLLVDFAGGVQRLSEERHGEVSADQVWRLFREIYVLGRRFRGRGMSGRVGREPLETLDAGEPGAHFIRIRAK